jgi:hypothetical protein
MGLIARFPGTQVPHPTHRTNLLSTLAVELRAPPVVSDGEPVMVRMLPRILLNNFM